MNFEQKSQRIGNVLRILITVPAIFFGIWVMSTNVSVEGSSSAEIQDFQNSFELNAEFFLAYLTIIGCAALVVIFFISMLITRPKEAIKGILSIIIAFVIFMILFSLGTSDTNESLMLGKNKISVDQSAIDFAHAGIWSVFIFILAGGLLIFGMKPILRLINKTN